MYMKITTSNINASIQDNENRIFSEIQNGIKTIIKIQPLLFCSLSIQILNIICILGKLLKHGYRYHK